MQIYVLFFNAVEINNVSNNFIQMLKFIMLISLRLRFNLFVILDSRRESSVKECDMLQIGFEFYLTQIIKQLIKITLSFQYSIPAII